MNTVLVSVDGSRASRAAVEWCAQNLTSTHRIIAVGGLGPVGEFVLDLPGFDVTDPSELRETFRSRWCAPLEAAGLDWHPRFLNQRQDVAVSELIERESPDLVVVGKPAHLAADLLVHGQMHHVLHHSDCPVLLVPAPTERATHGHVEPPIFEDAP